MRGEQNRRHNRKISRRCPVCGGRVIVGNHGCDWWVLCENNNSHIQQIRFGEPVDAIRAWESGDHMTNIEMIRSMSIGALAAYISRFCDCDLSYCPVRNAPVSCAKGCENAWREYLSREAKFSDIPMEKEE